MSESKFNLTPPSIGSDYGSGSSNSSFIENYLAQPVPGIFLANVFEGGLKIYFFYIIESLKIRIFTT